MGFTEFDFDECTQFYTVIHDDGSYDIKLQNVSGVVTLHFRDAIAFESFFAHINVFTGCVIEAEYKRLPLAVAR